MHRSSILWTVSFAALVSASCSDSPSCRCVLADPMIHIFPPRNWRGTADQVEGTGPGCSVNGSPQKAVGGELANELTLEATNDGACHVEVTDLAGVTIFAADSQVGHRGNETCCFAYEPYPNRFFVAGPDAGDAGEVPPIVIPLGDGGDASLDAELDADAFEVDGSDRD
jgi:hypothetical protein